MKLRQLLPSPPLTLTIIGFWMLMVSELSLMQLAFAAALGLVVPVFATRLDREFAGIGSLRPVPVLVLVVLRDMVRSNFEVARRVLGPADRIHPGFIWLPLDIRNIHGIAALTSFISLTPGTVSAMLSDDRRYLLVHVFNLVDPDALVADIKRRYEKPLMEIFP
ncbi:MAG TPA: Na+/H+ antiporter subunit E [Luteimonas sp.]|nr:Na+/H+ antiporter subunit E [Luteimonas sp.]